MLAALPAAAIAQDCCYEGIYDYRSEPLIVVMTKDCAGNDGLASFRAERVFKIETGNCQDPDDTDQPLYQLFLKTLTGGDSYEVLWLDSAGVKEIHAQLQENRRAALQRRSYYRPPEKPVDEVQREN